MIVISESGDVRLTERSHLLSAAFPSAPTYIYPSGHKTVRELVEERGQRMKENETKMMQIKEKEEELKMIEEKFIIALSTAIDKWVEHANDEGWLTSIVQLSTTLMYIFSLSCISMYSVSILLSSVSEADVRGFLESVGKLSKAEELLYGRLVLLLLLGLGHSKPFHC